METDEVVDEVLSHHGVLGMKWGRRGARASGGDHMIRVHDRGKRLRTTGGKGFPAHADAVRARTLGAKARKSGVKSLSNDELQAYTRRLQLEKSLKQVSSNDKTVGTKFATSVLKRVGNRAVDEVLNEATASVKKQIFGAKN